MDLPSEYSWRYERSQKSLKGRNYAKAEILKCGVQCGVISLTSGILALSVSDDNQYVAVALNSRVVHVFSMALVEQYFQSTQIMCRPPSNEDIFEAVRPLASMSCTVPIQAVDEDGVWTEKIRRRNHHASLDWAPDGRFLAACYIRKTYNGNPAVGSAFVFFRSRDAARAGGMRFDLVHTVDKHNVHSAAIGYGLTENELVIVCGYVSPAATFPLVEVSTREITTDGAGGSGVVDRVTTTILAKGRGEAHVAYVGQSEMVACVVTEGNRKGVHLDVWTNVSNGPVIHRGRRDLVGTEARMVTVDPRGRHVSIATDAQFTVYSLSLALAEALVVQTPADGTCSPIGCFTCTSPSLECGPLTACVFLLTEHLRVSVFHLSESPNGERQLLDEDGFNAYSAEPGDRQLSWGALLPPSWSVTTDKESRSLTVRSSSLAKGRSICRNAQKIRAFAGTPHFNSIAVLFTGCAAPIVHSYVAIRKVDDHTLNIVENIITLPTPPHREADGHGVKPWLAVSRDGRYVAQGGGATVSAWTLRATEGGGAAYLASITDHGQDAANDSEASFGRVFYCNSQPTIASAMGRSLTLWAVELDCVKKFIVGNDEEIVSVTIGSNIHRCCLWCGTSRGHAHCYVARGSGWDWQLAARHHIGPSRVLSMALGEQAAYVLTADANVTRIGRQGVSQPTSVDPGAVHDQGYIGLRRASGGEHRVVTILRANGGYHVTFLRLAHGKMHRGPRINVDRSVWSGQPHDRCVCLPPCPADAWRASAASIPVKRHTDDVENDAESCPWPFGSESDSSDDEAEDADEERVVQPYIFPAPAPSGEDVDIFDSDDELASSSSSSESSDSEVEYNDFEPKENKYPAKFAEIAVPDLLCPNMAQLMASDLHAHMKEALKRIYYVQSRTIIGQWNFLGNMTRMLADRLGPFIANTLVDLGLRSERVCIVVTAAQVNAMTPDDADNLKASASGGLLIVCRSAEVNRMSPGGIVIKEISEGTTTSVIF